MNSLDADLIFLQEVSPIKSRSLEIAKALRMDFVNQIDQGGIKIFGVGLPSKLSTGLTILARPGLKLKKIFGLKLSGLPGRVGSNFSFQLSENRFALIAQIETYKSRILLVGTHLHHGTENSEWIQTHIDELGTEGTITAAQAQILRDEIDDAEVRRLSELEILFSAVDVLAPNFDSIIFAGDFNSSDHAPAHGSIIKRGFKDTYREKHPKGDGFTWDSVKNKENILYGHNFDLPIRQFGIPKVKELFVEYYDRSRRIDFVTYRNRSKAGLAVASSELFHCGDDRLFGSDHFGVLTRFTHV